MESPRRKKRKVDQRICPFLGSVDRTVLDFDFQKSCSVTLKNIDVYCCLVCGKFFHGRAPDTPAYMHSVEKCHYVFINLENARVYCLPDEYEVVDSSLDDIKHNLFPAFSKEEISSIDTKLVSTKAAVSNEYYVPGFIGLNNLRCTDYINVVVHALARIVPLRNLLLDQEKCENVSSQVFRAYGMLMRKIFNYRGFRGHTSPHELVQAVNKASHTRFKIGQRSDAMEFLSWFLNVLERDVRSVKNIKNPISSSLRGKVEVKCVRELVPGAENDELLVDDDDKNVGVVKTDTHRFLMLSFDLPAAPLFKDAIDVNMIPQVSLLDLMRKYDGETKCSIPVKPGVVESRVYKLMKLPRYLILHYKRFRRNTFLEEKNTTLVIFPFRGLDLSHLLPDGNDAKAKCVYRLVASVSHASKSYQDRGLKAHEGHFIVHVYDKCTDKWLEIQDLDVTERLPQEVALSEAYIQVYERE